MAAVTIRSYSGAQENKICHCFHSFPVYLPWSDRIGCLLLFWMLSFQPAFSLSSFTLIKTLFSYSLFAIRVVPSALSEVVISPGNLDSSLLIHPAQHFTWCTLHISFTSRVTTYSLDVLLSQFWTPCCFMSGSIASWPAYRFLRRQVRWPDTPVSLRILHSLLWSTV